MRLEDRASHRGAPPGPGAANSWLCGAAAGICAGAAPAGPGRGTYAAHLPTATCSLPWRSPGSWPGERPLFGVGFFPGRHAWLKPLFWVPHAAERPGWVGGDQQGPPRSGGLLSASIGRRRNRALRTLAGAGALPEGPGGFPMASAPATAGFARRMRQHPRTSTPLNHRARWWLSPQRGLLRPPASRCRQLLELGQRVGPHSTVSQETRHRAPLPPNSCGFRGPLDDPWVCRPPRRWRCPGKRPPGLQVVPHGAAAATTGFPLLAGGSWSDQAHACGVVEAAGCWQEASGLKQQAQNGVRLRIHSRSGCRHHDGFPHDSRSTASAVTPP